MRSNNATITQQIKSAFFSVGMVPEPFQILLHLLLFNQINQARLKRELDFNRPFGNQSRRNPLLTEKLGFV